MAGKKYRTVMLIDDNEIDNLINQKMIEADLAEYIPPRVHLPDEQLVWQCEQAVRNYDPCISCATHFLKLRIDRG